MKKSIIREALNGYRECRNTAGTSKGGKKDLDSDIVCDTYEELKEKLSPELFSRHEKFVDALDDIWHEEVDDNFVDGFKLGLLIGLECMEDY